MPQLFRNVGASYQNAMNAPAGRFRQSVELREYNSADGFRMYY
jgi:hypothetical protein